jgi:predicted AAA+ superfamily ATPase
MKRSVWKKLIEWKDKGDRKPLILKGTRQVGKTYILQAFGQECFPCFHYVNFEKDEQLAKLFEKNLDPKRIIQDLNFYLDTSIDTGNDLLIFDEIQHCPRALTSLKYFQEELRELALCAAGSLLGIHLGNESFPIGKVEFLSMHPMSFEEFLRGVGDNKSFDFFSNYKSGDSISEIVHSHLWDQLKIYFVVGGLPEVVQAYADNKDDLFTALNLIRKKQENLITAYNADMAKHSGKQNAMHIDRLWRHVPAQLAREQNGSATKFKFKGIIPGVKAYSKLSGVIDWLQTAGLIIKVHIVNSGNLPFSAYIKENCFKLYLFDVGILGAISKLPPKTILDYEYGSYKGYFAENFVAQEFLFSEVEEIYSWREKNAVVEFLREVEGNVLPVEIKSGWVTQAKSLKVFAEKYNPIYKTVMSANNLYFDQDNRICRYPLYMASRFPFDL